MSEQFFSSLNLGEDLYNCGNLLIANQNGNVEADFVLHFILANFIRKHGSNGRVILILTKDTTSHWNAISSKLGWNLNSQIGSNVAVLDLSRQLYIMTRKNSMKTEDSPGGENKIPAVNTDGSFNLPNILEYCQSTIMDMKSKSEHLKFLLMFDDLTNLCCGGMNQYDNLPKSEKGTMDFIRRLLNLSDVCVAALTSCTGHLSKTLARVFSSTLFDISPLHTGYSHLFSGYLTLTRRSLDASSSFNEGFTKPFQFKLDERQISISPLTKVFF